MLAATIDRAFRRYVRTGDPGALERVFDGSAQQLYRLAWHLLGDRHAAEDAVQQTFVAAIEQAKGFDTTRRVMPWLCGILTNNALHMRRQARRRAAVTTAGEDAAVDPFVQASARETDALVAQRVRALAEPYREVLLLHLVHQQAPKEIAAALARPDATVRTQLARGLELLRRALPVGVAGLAAGQVPPAGGLAAVRAAVLAHAGAAAVAERGAAAAAKTVGFSGFGVVVMKKVLFGAALAAAVLCAWPLWSGNPAMPGAGGQSPGTTRAVAVQVVPQAAAASPVPQPADVQRVAVAPAIDPSASALEVLVHWADGTPAANVAVRCRPRPLDVEAWLQVARTDSDGIARFERVPPGAANAMTDRGAAVDVELAAGAAQRATITLPPGTDVRGRVVDLDGRPFPGATVWMSVARLSDDSEPIAVSGPDGTFTVRGAGLEHQLTATAPGFATAKEAVVRRSELVLTMRPAPGTIAGTVVDGHGRPCVGARVLVGMAMPARSGQGIHQRFLGEVIGQDVWPSRFARTDADGGFRVEGLPDWKWPMWIGAAGYAAHFEDVAVSAAGETRVRVQLQPGGSVRGRVVDDAGQPIAGAQVAAEVQLDPPDPRVSLGMNLNVAPMWSQTRAATGPDGRYEIAHVMPGKYVLTARQQQRSIDGLVEVRAGTAVWDAVLRPQQGNVMHGVLVDDTGAPLEKWTVRVEDRAKPGEAWRVQVRAGGEFRTKPVSEGRHRVFVRPRDPMIGDEIELGEFDVANCPLRLVVPRDRTPTARVRGRVAVPAEAKAPCHVSITDGRQTVRVQCDENGRWEAGPLRGGSYRLKADSVAFGVHGMGTVEVVDGRDTDAGVFDVPVPGTLLVTIVGADGKRRPDAWLTARAVGGGPERAQSFSGLEHQDGVVRGSLLPGRWVLTTVDATPLASMAVDVRSGATTEVHFVLPDSVPFRVHVPEAIRGRGMLRADWARHGVPVRDHPIWPNAAGEHLDFRAPLGAYTVEVADANGASAAATFELRDAGQVFELPLPPAPDSTAQRSAR